MFLEIQFNIMSNMKLNLKELSKPMGIVVYLIFDVWTRTLSVTLYYIN